MNGIGQEARAPRLGREFLMLPAGLIVWTTCFLILYAGQSLGCGAALQADRILGVNLLTVLLFAIVAVHLAAIGALLWRSVRVRLPRAQGTARFVHATAGLLHATALIGTLWLALPVTLLPPCG